MLKKKLFAVLLGGAATGATVELHDVVFVSANSIQEAYPQLKEKWFGRKDKVHLDSWMELTYADGYDIEIVPASEPPDENSLYFINIGSYPPGKLEETHTYLFLVGNSDAEIKKRAQDMGPDGHLVPHKDNQMLVDDIVKILIPGYQIKLTKTNTPKAVEIFSDYVPI